MSPKTIKYLMYFIFIPWMVAPVAAYVVNRWRGDYQQPAWMPLYTKVQVFDLAQGAIFTGMSLYHVNNQWLRHLTQPVVFIGMLWTIFRMAPDSKGRRILYRACMVAGLAAAVVGTLLDGMKWRNSVFTTTMSLVYLGLATRELRIISESNESDHLTTLPSFWVLAGLLVYSSGTVIFNATSNYFLRTLPMHLLFIPWVIVGIVHAIHEVLLAKAFLCKKPASS